MGLRTFSEFSANVTAAVARTPTSDELKRWINDAYREVAYAFDFPEFEYSTSFPTVAGTFSYDLKVLAPSYRKLHAEGVWIITPDENKAKLIRETRTRWIRNAPSLTDTTQRACPQYYHRYGKTLVVRPFPDKVYDISFHFWRQVTPLTSPTAVTEIDEDWDEIVELGALYRAFRRYREFDRFLNIRNEHLALIRSRSLEMDSEEIEQGGLYIAHSETDIQHGG